MGMVLNFCLSLTFLLVCLLSPEHPHFDIFMIVSGLYAIAGGCFCVGSVLSKKK